MMAMAGIIAQGVTTHEPAFTNLAKAFS